MNIIGSVSNRVEIYPLKTKSEEEIADRFLQYVCTYGPVKRIRSDMEPGLFGRVMEKIKTAMGVEWSKTVAAYSPSHNGKIEKFVGTLKNALRKLAERDHRKWVEMLKFVKLAYNTRVHSVTKMTPFELHFGVKANTFDDYSQCDGEIDEQAILKRADQIRKLVEIREKVVAEVELQQEKQMDKQNKRTKRIERTFLENGTTVYRRNDGIITALALRWIGPYKIFDHDERGNYRLEDEMGNGLQQKFPLEKLWVVRHNSEIVSGENLDEICEVKEIIDDRTINNKIEYKVKWSDKSTDSWVKESDFGTVEVINEYWKRKFDKDKGIQRRKRGRPRINLLTLVTIMFKITLMFSLFLSSDGQNFSFCRSNERMSLINLDELCNWSQEKVIINNQKELTQIMKDPIILNKIHNEVSGAGFRCYAKRKSFSYKRSFFGVDTLMESEWINLKPTVTDCWYMVKTGRCRIEGNKFDYDRKMKCFQEKWEIYDVPAPKYNWMDENLLQAYDCGFFQIGVIAEKVDSEIFYEKRCKANAFKCENDNSILVGNASIIHKCPYEYLTKEGTFELTANNLVINKAMNLVLQPTKYKQICYDIMAFETTEGLLITKNDYALKTALLNKEISRAKNTEDLVHKLVIANIDFNHVSEVEMLKLIDIQLCATLGTILNLASRLNNEYFELMNSKGQKAILFAKHGLIFAPECVKVDNVSAIQEVGNDCFREVLVKYLYKNSSKVGYLTGKIIREIGNRIDCNDESDVVFIGSSLVQRRNKNIYQSDKNVIKWSKVGILLDNLKVNTHHNEAIMSSTNELEMFFELEKQVVGNHMIIAEPIPDQLANNVIEKYIDSFKYKLMSPFRTVWNYIYILGFWTVVSLILKILSFACYKTRCCYISKCLTFHNQQKTEQKRRKDNYMQNNALNSKVKFKNNNVLKTTNTIAKEIPMVVQMKPLLEREQSETNWILSSNV